MKCTASQIIVLLASSAFSLPELSGSKTIRELVKEINDNPNVSWKAGFNKKFDPDRKPADYAHLMGTVPHPMDFELPEVDFVVSDIPDSFNSRDQWGSMCPSLYEIRDQGNCGSCWAFGAVEAFTDRACIQSNGATTVDMSAEDLVSCCHSCGLGCHGGSLGPSWVYLMNIGICTGGLYEGTGCRPYSILPCEHHMEGGDRPDCADTPNARTPRCTSECVDGYDNSYANDFSKTSTAYRVGSPRKLAQIQSDLMTNGPIEVSFTVYEDFETYTGGVYFHQSGKSLGGHAVKLMGWGIDEDTGMDYWLIANSWNSDWGENGDFRIRRGTNECGIEQGGWAGMVE